MDRRRQEALMAGISSKRNLFGPVIISEIGNLFRCLLPAMRNGGRKSRLKSRGNILLQVFAIVFTVLIFQAGSGSEEAQAATYYSRANANWATASTWSTSACGGTASAAVPGAADTVQICAGNTVTMNGNPGSALSLTINGTANWTNTNTTNVGNGGITINSGGNITGTSAGILTTTGNLTVNANTTSTAVAVRMQTTGGQTISGTGSLGNLAINSTTTNNGNLTVTTALSGTSALTNGSNATLNIGGTSGLTTLTATAAGNAVNYYGAAQTVKATTYSNLTLSGSGTKTTTGATVNGVLSMQGTATVSAAPAYGTAATLQYNTATARTAGVEWVSPYTATGGIVIAGTGVISMNSAETVNAPLAINSGASLDVSTNNYALTLSGSWTNNGTFNARAGTVTFNGTTGQGISGATTWYNLSVTGGGRTVSFQSGALQTVSNAITLTGAAGNLLVLAPSTAGSAWLLHAPATQSISYVSASYSNASGGTAVAANNGTNTNGGNNTNWVFVTVTSTSPNTLAQNSPQTTVTITGTGFKNGAAVSFGDANITPGTVNVTNSTTITVPVTVGAGATIGAHNVTVTNTDNATGTGTGAFTVTDGIAPASTITSPATGSVYNLSSPGSVAISGAASDNAAVSSIQVSTDGGDTWNTATCSGCPGSNVTWTYNWSLPTETVITHNILSRATDTSGNVETPGAGITVTNSRVRPTVSSTTPANSTAGVTINSSVTINFSENVDCNSVTISSVTISPNNGWTKTSCSGSQAIFTPSNQSRTSTAYTVTVGTGVTDTTGNAMASQYQFSYTTATFTQSLSIVPTSGTDTSDGKFTLSNVQINDEIRDAYQAPLYAYDETLYQEYDFSAYLCATAQINSVAVTIDWKVAKTPAAKLEVFDHTGAFATYNLNPTPNDNSEEMPTITLTNILTPADVNNLKIRFLAYGGTSPAIDYINVTVNYTDNNVCIWPGNFSYAPGATTASYSHVIASTPGQAINLSSASENGWPVRIYQGTGSINIDGTLNVTKSNNTPVSQVTTNGSGNAFIVVETDVPSGTKNQDVATITATASSSSSTADTTVSPADGTMDSEYLAPYAIREYFDYGPDPNRASGEVHRYVKDGIMHIYYEQNARNINDNTYNGLTSAADNTFGDWAQYGWGAAGAHTLNDLFVSDKTEFIFYDQNGNIKLDFFSDYLSQVNPTTLYPSGYHSCGFQASGTGCDLNATSDGSLIVNNSPMSASQLAQLISIESSEAYNLNHYTQTVGGLPLINCGSYGTSFDLTHSSPPINRTTYALLCPGASDYQFSYAIEVIIPIAQIFPNEPAITVVARAHNSPNKNGDRDNPPTPASASIGDYVWYDMNGDGVQDSWESGIPNVRVVLYWDRNGDGLFTPDEELMETRTDATGHYLFEGIYGGQFYSTNEGTTIDDGQYKVWVDESTIPPGFVRSTTNPYVLSNTITGVCSLTQYGNQSDCTNNGGTWTPTSRGSLGNTESCLTADFGYKPAGGVIGDFVWYDSNDNGIEDQGEVGIANVTLNLLDAASGSVLQTTTTNSEGRYFFTGLPAGTYKVQVTDTNSVLTGYTHTIGNDSLTTPTQSIVLGTNGVALYADFGYYTNTACATGSVSGQVFFDQNWDRVFDGTDSGIAGVGVSIWQDANGNGLLDETDPFVGSTTTDSNGNFHFYGLPVSAGGTTYILQVPNDPSGLNKFYPGGGDVVTLSSSSCSTTANFPYVGTGVIGDFIWNDLNDNGIQDSGEPGIGGVTVQAQYCSPSIPPPGCDNTFTFNTATDSTGHYMFTGLRTTDLKGNAGARYRIIVTDTNHVLTGWNTSPQYQGGDTTVDSNNPNYTDVTIGTSGPSSFSDLTIDFGYNNPSAVFGSIGDYIWEDVNGDGLQNEGSGYGFNGVTVELRDANNNTIATTTTSGDGGYLFQGLTASAGGTQYHVVITDINGVLNGYSMTTDPNALNVTLTTAAPNVLTADAGYQYRPTKAVVSDFRGSNSNGRVAIEWNTVSEVGTAGFYLFRLDGQTGKFLQINSRILPALVGSPSGGSYRLIDNGASPKGDNTYLLVEVENRGKQKAFGPYVVAGTGPAARKAALPRLPIPPFDLSKDVKPIVSDYSRTPRPSMRGPLAAPSAAAPVHQQAVIAGVTTVYRPLKVQVTENGMYYIDASTIASAFQTSTANVTAMIGQNHLSVSNMGQQVAYDVASGDSGIIFYGQTSGSQYAAANVYWINKSDGLRMANVIDTTPQDTNPGATFSDNVHYEQNVFNATALFSDPSADYWFWDYVVAGDPTNGTKSFTIHVAGVAQTANNALLTVNLQGATDTPAALDHHAVISLNGAVIGEGSWAGLDSATLTASFSQSLLHEGDNTVTVTGILDSDVPYSIFYVNSFDLSYQRLYQASGNSIVFRGDNNQVVTVSEFTGNNISVYDITNPGQPQIVGPSLIDGTAGNYSVTFIPASPTNVYIAVTPDAATPITSATTVRLTTLKSKSNAADYMIITTPELKPAADSLALYRSGQGLATKVVLFQDIIDTFNYGVFSPDAIKGFLSYAYNYWSRPPRYVLLAGNGTNDYKNYMGYGDNLIPPMMVGTPNGLFSSDNYYADINGDYFPEMVIGRIPATTVDQLQAVVDKIISYESSSGQWTDSVLMLADIPDDSGNYPAESDTLASLLPSAFTPSKIYLSQYPISNARSLLMSGINSGAMLINYTGHGGVDRLSQGGLLTTADVPSLADTQTLPILTAMTCVVAQFDIPGFDTLGETLVLQPGGGTAAAWSPTGMSINFQGNIVNKAFFNSVFVEKQKVLGEAVMEALGSYMVTGNDPYLIDILELLGDPALRLR